MLKAISFARLSNLIFSAEDPKSGGVIHGPKIFESSSCHHKPNVIRVNDNNKSKNLLQKFFKSKRSKRLKTVLSSLQMPFFSGIVSTAMNLGMFIATIYIIKL